MARTAMPPTPKLPDPPASLDSKGAATLASHTQAALSRQRRELEESIDKAFEHIPWPVRGAVRKVLGA